MRAILSNRPRHSNTVEPNPFMPVARRTAQLGEMLLIALIPAAGIVAALIALARQFF